MSIIKASTKHVQRIEQVSLSIMKHLSVRCQLGVHVFNMIIFLQTRVHPLQGRHKTPSCTNGILKQGRAHKLKFTSNCPTLVYLFIYYSCSFSFLLFSIQHDTSILVSLELRSESLSIPSPFTTPTLHPQREPYPKF